MEDLFTSLSRAVESTPMIALGASLLWGILSVLLSPCHLTSIPLIIGFINDQAGTSTKRAFYLSFLFSIGILVTIALIGVITSTAGRLMGDVGSYGNYFVALIFFVIGLHLLDVIPLPLPGGKQIVYKRKGLLAAFIIGLLYGIALGPCTFAYMAPMLAVAFRLSSESIYYGVLLLSVYGIGHCLVIVAAGTSAKLVQNYLNWNEQSKGTVLVRKICGVLVILGGVYMIYITA